MSRDITERRNIEQQLLIAQTVIKSCVSAISTAGLDGRLTYVNPAFLELWGYGNPDEILGRSFTSLCKEEEKAQVLIQTLLTRRGVEAAELVGKKKSGAEFIVGLKASLIVDAEGQPTGMTFSLADITERKQAEENERRLQRELNISNRLASIGQMASGVAHEINNPLTSVIGFSQLLMNKDIPDDIRANLQVINSQAQRVAKIVENLLTFARQHESCREYVDINESITKALELRSYEMRTNTTQLMTRLVPDLPQTLANANQIQQVVLNIILNAEKEMTKAHNRGKLSIKTERIGDRIRISFTDDGPGISKENLDRIFDPFFTTREVGDGTGLGLSICHSIIAQHGGRLYAESELGEGATFVIELPIVADTDLTESVEVIEEEPQEQGGVKILVVDDEPTILHFLKILLTEQGYEVETVDSAHVALERLHSERYDLILLDIKLPVMNGIELYRHIEAMDLTLAQRIILITGDIMGASTKDFLDETKVPYIAKPFSIEHLNKEMNRILTKEPVRQQSSKESRMVANILNG